MTKAKHGFYPRHREQGLDAAVSFPKLEEDVLRYWDRDRTFRKSVERRPTGRHGEDEFVFYDGPPFANGLPHYGHLLTGYVKDIVGRYQTMLGHHVERRFGWDTHGLPAEMETERELGIHGKQDVMKMGIAAFNDACRASVLKYTGEWRDYVTRQARWVDFDNDYKTLDLPYMESVMWAFKRLWDKGLIYEGYRVLPYSWYEQTPLSNQETHLDDAYKMRRDPTVTTTFPLRGSKARELGLEGVRAIGWTTTPWTTPTNLAIAVGPSIDYAVVPSGPNGTRDGQPVGTRYLLAAELVGAHAAQLGYDSAEEARAAVEHTLPGQQLEHVHYEPLFDYFTDAAKWGTKNAFQVLLADYVTTDEGTGVVHEAPAYGEEDQINCARYGIPVVLSLDYQGNFLDNVPDVAGMHVFDANKPITELLAKRGRLLAHGTIDHSYPHSWRSGTPLIYMALPSWFVKVTAFKDRMLALNQQIHWIPENVKDGQFGKWLAGARDWNISRNRYWGAPLPVWKSDNPKYPRVDVYGSIADLERDFGQKVTNLHRPYVDQLTRPNPDDPTGKSTMRRVPEVLDCWFESGSMPFAQVHYPFENQQWFEDHFPGDFIVEYIGQTRGWFYTLHVLATALFDKPAFLHCVSHGIVLGADGRKMSKSLRNYPDVNLVFNEFGSDAMRWFLMCSPVVRGGNISVSREGVRDVVRQVLLPLWNVYHFFALYADACGRGEGYLAKALDLHDRDAVRGLNAMDRYLLARTRGLALQVRSTMDAYDIHHACELVRDYLDVLTNWYVRTQRARFWAEDHAAFDTLYTVLEALCRIAAPLLPLLCEEIWRGLTGGESVHLTDYPSLPDTVADEDLVSAMDAVREDVSAAHFLRKTHGLRVRQPLASVEIVRPDAERLRPFADLIASEVNVKRVRLRRPEDSGLTAHQALALNPPAFPPSLRKQTSRLFAARKAGQWRVEDAGRAVVFDGVSVDGRPVRLTGDQFSLSTEVEAKGGFVASVLANGTFVVLDTTLTPELKAEGYARDVVRAVQDARKQADLEVTDRIDLRLGVPAEHVADVRAHQGLIAHETLARSVDVEEAPELRVDVEKRVAERA